MSILLGWKWRAFADDRDLPAVIDAWERWDVLPVANDELGWRSARPDGGGLFGHFTAPAPPAACLKEFELSPLIDDCVRRVERRRFDVNGRIYMSIVTAPNGDGSALQLEVVSAAVEELAPRLAEVFREHGMVLYSPGDDTLYSRGATDTVLLSGSFGHRWQPAWKHVTSALQELTVPAVLVLENERGDIMRLAGGKGALAVESHLAGDPVTHAIAGRGTPTATRAFIEGAPDVFSHEVLCLDDAFHLLKSFYEDGVRSPWFSWRPAQ